MQRPPCWPERQPCPNRCADELYQRSLYNHVDLTGPWAGWRLRGWHLISPHGERISPAALDRMMFRERGLFEHPSPGRRILSAALATD